MIFSDIWILAIEIIKIVLKIYCIFSMYKSTESEKLSEVVFYGFLLITLKI